MDVPQNPRQRLLAAIADFPTTSELLTEEMAGKYNEVMEKLGHHLVAMFQVHPAGFDITKLDFSPHGLSALDRWLVQEALEYVFYAKDMEDGIVPAVMGFYVSILIKNGAPIQWIGGQNFEHYKIKNTVTGKTQYPYVIAYEAVSSNAKLRGYYKDFLGLK